MASRIIRSEYDKFEGSEENNLQSSLHSCEDTAFGIAFGKDFVPINFFLVHGSSSNNSSSNNSNNSSSSSSSSSSDGGSAGQTWTIRYDGSDTLSLSIVKDTFLFLQDPKYSTNIQALLPKFFATVTYCSENEEPDDDEEEEMDDQCGSGENSPVADNSIVRVSSYFFNLNKRDTEIRDMKATALSKAEEKAKESNFFGEDNSTKIIISELRHFLTSGYLDKQESIVTDNNNIEICCLNQDVFVWRIKFKATFFNPEVQTALVSIDSQFGYQDVELELTFTRGVYPFYPPRINLIRPRFHGAMLKNLTSMPELSLSTWSPVRGQDGLMSIFKSIRSVLEKGQIDVDSETNNRIDFPFGAYLHLDTLLSQLDTVRKEIDENVAANVAANKSTNVKAKTSSTAAAEKNPGTLYASSNARAWDHNAWIKAKAENSRLKAQILTEICEEFKKMDRDFCGSTNASRAAAGGDQDGDLEEKNVKHWHRVQLAINESCLSNFILDALQTDSYIEFSKDPDLFNSVFTILYSLLNIPHFRCFFERSPDGAAILVRLNKLDSGSDSGSGGNSGSSAKSGGAAGGSDMDSDFPLLETVLGLKRKYVTSAPGSPTAKEGGVASAAGGGGGGGVDYATRVSDVKSLYAQKMLEMAYGDVDFEQGLRGNSYQKEISANTGVRTKEGLSRLRLESREIKKESKNNVHWPSSVWIRYLAGRTDCLQFAISGNEDTPYWNGIFLFDAYYPSDYPENPPKVNLKTTGGGVGSGSYKGTHGAFFGPSDWINPNLYKTGKVCLSLLGTWAAGTNSDNWMPTVSKMDHVFLAIQSAIMHDKPYFNEPGLQGHYGTPEGDRKSKAYNSDIRIECVRWAMIDQIKNPKPGFKSVIRTHFTLKKEEILAQVQAWMKEDPSLSTLVMELTNLLDGTTRSCLTDPEDSPDCDETGSYFL